MENFGKNEQNPHDNLSLKFGQKLLKWTKPTKKVWVQEEFILFFLLITGHGFHAFSDRCSMYRKSFHECVSQPTCWRWVNICVHSLCISTRLGKYLSAESHLGRCLARHFRFQPIHLEFQDKGLTKCWIQLKVFHCCNKGTQQVHWPHLLQMR